MSSPNYDRLVREDKLTASEARELEKQYDMEHFHDDGDYPDFDQDCEDDDDGE